MSKPIIAVVGATGAQGGSVVRHLHASGKWRVRALTRNPDSPKALHLAEQGVDVVKCDTLKPSDLESAFKGAYGVFGVTFVDFETDLDETIQGINIVNAVKAQKVQHLVLSTLPNAEKCCNGKRKVTHFTRKANFGEYARNESTGAFSFTAVQASAYYENNLVGAFGPRLNKDGKLAISMSAYPTSKIPMFSVEDTGGVVAAIFDNKEKGLVIWRIEKFTVREIPKSTYGRFYNGDSYILLHTYTKHPGSQALNYDIHFWLGSKTTQDEAGTAAYKTVELDDYLGGMAVQHREVEKYESDLFLSYFPVPLTILAGGIESGFTHVKDLGKEYRPRLLHLKGLKQVRILEVPLSYKSLNGGDVFILDTGMHLYQWYGVYAGVNERHKAAELCRSLVDERKGEPKITVYHEGEKDIAPEFWKHLGGQGPIASAAQGGDDAEFEKNSKLQKRLFKLSDESGTLKFTQIAEGAVKRSLLESKDAFIFDTGTEVFAWIGLRASNAERKHSLKYAQDYLTKFNRPAYISVCRILEGAENRFFESSFDSV